jgi:hypothetical protein
MMESNQLKNGNYDNQYDVLVVKLPEKPQVKQIIDIDKKWIRNMFKLIFQNYWKIQSL